MTTIFDELDETRAEQNPRANSPEALLKPVLEFLQCTTPDAWIDEAKKPENLSLILRDHLLCELKASQTAMFMVRKYAVDKPSGQILLDWAKPYEDFAYKWQLDTVFPDKNIMQASKLTPRKTLPQASDLIDKMVRLIKEEFHHFEQVLAIMKDRDIPYQNLKAGRYAKGLMKCVRTFEPEALIDKLIIGAYIEARSCERFAKLAPFLDEELNKFYVSLLRSESRHYQDYLKLAGEISKVDISERVTYIGQCEAELIQSDDVEFRFHSGKPISISEGS